MPGIFPALGKRLVFSRLAGLHAGYFFPPGTRLQVATFPAYDRASWRAFFSPLVCSYVSLVLPRMTGLHSGYFFLPLLSSYMMRLYRHLAGATFFSPIPKTWHWPNSRIKINNNYLQDWKELSKSFKQRNQNEPNETNLS